MFDITETKIDLVTLSVCHPRARMELKTKILIPVDRF